VTGQRLRRRCIQARDGVADAALQPVGINLLHLQAAIVL
jgi:hypothetical protein